MTPPEVIDMEMGADGTYEAVSRTPLAPKIRKHRERDQEKPRKKKSKHGRDVIHDFKRRMNSFQEILPVQLPAVPQSAIPEILVGFAAGMALVDFISDQLTEL